MNMQNWNRAPQVLKDENRCSMLMRKMNECKKTAQQCLNTMKSPNAMEGTMLQQSRSSRISHNLASTDLHNVCRWWLEQEASKRNQEIRWKELKKFERIWENLRWKGFGSEIVKCCYDFLLWLALYTTC